MIAFARRETCAKRDRLKMSSMLKIKERSSVSKQSMCPIDDDGLVLREGIRSVSRMFIVEYRI